MFGNFHFMYMHNLILNGIKPVWLLKERNTYVIVLLFDNKHGKGMGI